MNKNKSLLICGILIVVILSNCSPGRKEVVNKYYSDPYPEIKLNKFIQLPVGAVQPDGWLRQELEAWAAGITGHINEYKPGTFWNAWDNRKFRKETWWPYEQQAYWADGLFQLAYILDDSRLKGIAADLAERILSGQNQDGYFGGWPDSPYSNDGEIYTLSLISQAMMSYYSATGDKRVIAALQKGFIHVYEQCPPLPDSSGILPLAWRGGSYGWPSASHIIYPIFRVYSITGDRKLLDLAELIFKAGQETNPGAARSDIQVRNLLAGGNTPYDMHGVDATEVLRIPAIHYLISGAGNDLAASIKGVGKIERYSEQVYGAPSSDEQLREPGAINSTETCTQSTWSATKQTLFTITGDVHYADGVEKIVYNIGPGSRRSDGRAIQYYSAPNQVACTDNSNRAPLEFPDRQSFRPDGDPEVPCCIGQSNRLYPNFVKDAMWMASEDNGLAAVCYGPSHVTALAGNNGDELTISEITGYPFDDEIRFAIKAKKTIDFPLYLRIPEWCNNPEIYINASKYDEEIFPGTMVRIFRLWHPGDTILLKLPMKIHLSTWNNSSVAVERGPLVYSLKIKPVWKKTGERFHGFPDWECRAGSDWNYALCFSLESNGTRKFPLISRDHATDPYFTVRHINIPEGSSPWDYSPVELLCKGKKVSQWTMTEENVTPDVPISPVINANPEEEITLIPLGSAPVRITYFPVAEKQQK